MVIAVPTFTEQWLEKLHAEEVNSAINPYLDMLYRANECTEQEPKAKYAALFGSAGVIPRSSPYFETGHLFSKNPLKLLKTELHKRMQRSRTSMSSLLTRVKFRDLKTKKHLWTSNLFTEKIVESATSFDIDLLRTDAEFGDYILNLGKKINSKLEDLANIPHYFQIDDAEEINSAIRPYLDEIANNFANYKQKTIEINLNYDLAPGPSSDQTPAARSLIADAPTPELGTDSKHEQNPLELLKIELHKKIQRSRTSMSSLLTREKFRDLKTKKRLWTSAQFTEKIVESATSFDIDLLRSDQEFSEYILKLGEKINSKLEDIANTPYYFQIDEVEEINSAIRPYLDEIANNFADYRQKTKDLAPEANTMSDALAPELETNLNHKQGIPLDQMQHSSSISSPEAKPSITDDHDLDLKYQQPTISKQDETSLPKPDCSKLFNLMCERLLQAKNSNNDTSDLWEQTEAHKMQLVDMGIRSSSLSQPIFQRLQDMKHSLSNLQYLDMIIECATGFYCNLLCKDTLFEEHIYNLKAIVHFRLKEIKDAKRKSVFDSTLGEAEAINAVIRPYLDLMSKELMKTAPFHRLKKKTEWDAYCPPVDPVEQIIPNSAYVTHPVPHHYSFGKRVCFDSDLAPDVYREMCDTVLLINKAEIRQNTAYDHALLRRVHKLWLQYHGLESNLCETQYQILKKNRHFHTNLEYARAIIELSTKINTKLLEYDSQFAVHVYNLKAIVHWTVKELDDRPLKLLEDSSCIDNVINHYLKLISLEWPIQEYVITKIKLNPTAKTSEAEQPTSAHDTNDPASPSGSNTNDPASPSGSNTNDPASPSGSRIN